MSSTAFLGLSRNDRKESLAFSAQATGRPDYILEKDVWVVWCLDVLFSHRFGEALVFKGGTSLSKAFGVIRRFSEDIDLTYDIRALAPELIGLAIDGIPASRNESKRWSDAIRRKHLPEWITASVVPALRARAEQDGAELTVALDATAEEPCTVDVSYPPSVESPGYMKQSIRLEFGGRSTGEPTESVEIRCDAEEHLAPIAFPAARVRAMRAERTFYEKATAVHVFCTTGRGLSDRLSRHWSDLLRLDDAGFVTRALADRALARKVAREKTMFFQVSGVDYRSAVEGAMRLVPEAEGLTLLRADYEAMVAAGFFLDTTESFDELVNRCRELEVRINGVLTD